MLKTVTVLVLHSADIFNCQLILSKGSWLELTLFHAGRISPKRLDGW